MRGNVGGQAQTGSQAQSGQAFSSQPFQSLPQVVQIPLAAAAVPIPSLHMVVIYSYIDDSHVFCIKLSFIYLFFPSFQPIPDSLSTLTEFMNRMEQTLSQSGDSKTFLTCSCK